MNILIIDDEHELLERLSSVLTKENYTVITAADGQEGLDKLWDERYDLVLLDIMLRTSTVSKCCKRYAPPVCPPRCLCSLPKGISVTRSQG